MELIFGIDIQNKFSISYAWDKEKMCYIQNEGKFLTYTRNCKQKATVGTVKYHHDTMVFYQLELVDQLLQNRWHISSGMTILPREET